MKTKIKNIEVDMKRIDDFNNFMLKKGAFVKVGDQIMQNPAYAYSYASLYEEFKKLYT